MAPARLKYGTARSPPRSSVFACPGAWPDSLQPLLKDQRTRHNAIFQSVVESGVRSGEFTCPDVGVALECLHGILNQSAVWLHRDDPDLQSSRRATVAAAMRLFR